MTAGQLEERLRSEGRSRYHDRHPFHLRMHAGQLTRDELRRWVANRYYYQTRIPIKDALIVSKSEDATFRRLWLRRIVDHDGADATSGGLAQWQRLAAAVGIARDELLAFTHVLPAVRFACDAYVQLVRERSLVEAVAASLTEFFSPDIMAQRIRAWEQHYTWIDPDSLAYFRGRVTRAREDSREALDFVLATASDPETQQRCVSALVTKCEILWALLDAVAAG